MTRSAFVTADARFEDGASVSVSGRPVRVRADTAEDLAILSSLVQDSVGLVREIAWLKKKHRLVLLLNRLRWEQVATRGGRPERVRSALTIEGVMSVRCRGIDPCDKDGVIALLSLDVVAGPDGGGRILVRCAGGPELMVEVECLDVSLEDVSRPWPARTAVPVHDD